MEILTKCSALFLEIPYIDFSTVKNRGDDYIEAWVLHDYKKPLRMTQNLYALSSTMRQTYNCSRPIITTTYIAYYADFMQKGWKFGEGDEKENVNVPLPIKPNSTEEYIRSRLCKNEKANLLKESISSNVVTPKAETASSQERVITKLLNSKQTETEQNEKKS